MNENKNETFLTTDDLCHMLGLGRNSVYLLLKDGSIKSYRFRNKYKVKQSDLDQYINSQIQADKKTEQDHDSGNY